MANNFYPLLFLIGYIVAVSHKDPLPEELSPENALDALINPSPPTLPSRNQIRANKEKSSTEWFSCYSCCVVLIDKENKKILDTINPMENDVRNLRTLIRAQPALNHPAEIPYINMAVSTNEYKASFPVKRGPYISNTRFTYVIILGRLESFTSASNLAEHLTTLEEVRALEEISGLRTPLVRSTVTPAPLRAPPLEPPADRKSQSDIQDKLDEINRLEKLVNLLKIEVSKSSASAEMIGQNKEATAKIRDYLLQINGLKMGKFYV